MMDVLIAGMWIVGAILFCLLMTGPSLGKTAEEQYREDELQMQELSKKNRDRKT
jgi:hypothetical protein